MSKSWYSRINELELKDGSTKIDHHLVFETDSKEIKKKVESFFKSIMDGKENCEWIKYDYRTICPINHDANNPYWRIPENTDKLKYCPYCGKEIKIID